MRISNRIIFIFSLFLVSIFTSCSTIFSKFTYSDNSNIATFKIVASSLDKCISFNRTLMPARLYSDDLDFYIYGKKKNGMDESLLETKKVEFEASDPSGVSGLLYFEFEKAVYDLYLAAVPKGKSFNKNQLYINTVLIGLASVDLNYGESIVFYLSPVNLDSVENAYGQASLYLYSKDWNMADYSDFTVKAGIYDQASGVLVKDNAYKSVDLKYHSSNPENNNLPPSAYDESVYAPNYVCNDIMPGLYNFIVSFVGSQKTYNYHTTIRIFASQTVKETVLIPNVIALPPAAPSNFTAGYQDPLDENDSSFYIEFDWADNSNNEEYFQLEILDLSSADLIDGDISIPSFLSGDVETNNIYWNNFLNNRGASVSIFKNTDLDNDLKIDGSLILNSNFVVLREPLGTCSIARLCAVNEDGKSQYVYADIFSATSFRSSVCSARAWSPESRFINRFKVSYNVSVGNFYDDDDESLLSENLLPSYYTNALADSPLSAYSGGFYAENPLSREYGSEGKRASLKYYDNASSSYFDWTGWQLGSELFADNSNISSRLYKDFKNVTFFALYNGSYQIGEELLHSYCSCDTNFDSDIYVTVDNTNDYTYFNYGEDYFEPVCSNSSDCHYSPSCTCPAYFTFSKASKRFIHILCKKHNITMGEDYDSISLNVFKNGSTAIDSPLPQTVSMTLGSKPAENFTHFIVDADDLSEGEHSAFLTFVKENTSFYYTLRFIVTE